MKILGPPYYEERPCNGYPHLVRIIPTDIGNLTTAEFAAVVGIKPNGVVKRFLRLKWDDPQLVRVVDDDPVAMAARVAAIKAGVKKKEKREAAGESGEFAHLLDTPRSCRLPRLGSWEERNL